MTKLPTLAQVRDDLFAKALQVHGGSVQRAARAVGVGRSTFYRWTEENPLVVRFILGQKTGAESTRPARRPARDLPAGEP